MLLVLFKARWPFRDLLVGDLGFLFGVFDKKQLAANGAGCASVFPILAAINDLSARKTSQTLQYAVIRLSIEANRKPPFSSCALTMFSSIAG
jgi:hypothetical protein